MMKVHQKGHTIIIEDTNSDFVSLVTNLVHEFDQFKQHNLIVDLSHYRALNAKDINTFLSIAKNCKKNKKSFVIVIEDFDFNSTSNLINVVPSLPEAHDIIEMEEIERDLGF